MEDSQSRIAWQTINEVSRKKSKAKEKLKAANQQERIKLWKQHFENPLGNPPKVMLEPITRIISKQLDIKLRPFTHEELDSVLRKFKNRKAAGMGEITPEVWKTRQFDDIQLRHCDAVYNQNPIDIYIYIYIYIYIDRSTKRFIFFQKSFRFYAAFKANGFFQRSFNDISGVMFGQLNPKPL